MKAQGGPAHGVGQIHPPGIPGLAVHGVHHQRQGGQGEQLIKRYMVSIGGEGDAQGHTKADEVKDKEAVLAPPGSCTPPRTGWPAATAPTPGAAKRQDRPSTWKGDGQVIPPWSGAPEGPPRRVNTAARAHTAVRQADPTTKFCRAVRSLGRQAARAPPPAWAGRNGQQHPHGFSLSGGFDGANSFILEQGPTTPCHQRVQHPGNIPSSTTAAVSRHRVIHMSQVSCCCDYTAASKSFPGKRPGSRWAAGSPPSAGRTPSARRCQSRRPGSPTPAGGTLGQQPLGEEPACGRNADQGQRGQGKHHMVIP